MHPPSFPRRRESTFGRRFIEFHKYCLSSERISACAGRETIFHARFSDDLRATHTPATGNPRFTAADNAALSRMRRLRRNQTNVCACMAMSSERDKAFDFSRNFTARRRRRNTGRSSENLGHAIRKSCLLFQPVRYSLFRTCLKPCSPTLLE